jgi:hypothetical protein
MSDDPNKSNHLFDSPASQVEALRFPEDLWEQLKSLYAQTLPDGQSGGMEVTGIRLARQPPSALDTEGAWKNREGWVMCKCALTQDRFAVPDGEPVPIVEIEYRFEDGTESVFYRPVHPELAADRSKLAERLVADLGRQTHESLLDLISVAARLKALSGMEELPTGPKDESDAERAGRCNYEPIGDTRP